MQLIVIVKLCCVKYRNFTLIPGVKIFMEKHNFRRVLGDSLETLQKLGLSAKIPHRKLGKIRVFLAVKGTILVAIVYVNPWKKPLLLWTWHLLMFSKFPVEQVKKMVFEWNIFGVGYIFRIQVSGWKLLFQIELEILS